MEVLINQSGNMKLRNFIVDIKDGKPSFTSDHQRNLFYQYLAQFEDKKVTISIDPKVPTRSAQQNNYYWLYLSVIARETGYSPNELHNLFKGKFLSSGIVEIFSEKVRKTKSTTQLNKSEFAEYIMQIAEFTEIAPPDTTPYTLVNGIN